MTLKKLLLMGCLGGALAFTACDKDDDDPIVTEEFTQTDSTFLMTATQGNLAEIQTGQLAATQGSSDSVKMLGQLLVTEHQTAQSELATIASGRSIMLPDSADAAGRGMYNALLGLNGGAFDSAFIHMQMVAHDSAISVYQSYANDASSFSSLKAYANKYLPKLQEHATMVDSLSARLPQ